tara:strand:+ start:504 stop:992 length:489 start_codon:yes stop_codon:yes gene_type:complete
MPQLTVVQKPMKSIIHSLILVCFLLPLLSFATSLENLKNEIQGSWTLNAELTLEVAEDQMKDRIQKIVKTPAELTFSDDNICTFALIGAGRPQWYKLFLDENNKPFVLMGDTMEGSVDMLYALEVKEGKLHLDAIGIFENKERSVLGTLVFKHTETKAQPVE